MTLALGVVDARCVIDDISDAVKALLFDLLGGRDR